MGPPGEAGLVCTLGEGFLFFIYSPFFINPETAVERAKFQYRGF